MKRYFDIRRNATAPEGVAYRRKVSAVVRGSSGGVDAPRATEGVAKPGRLACSRYRKPRIYVSGPMTGRPGYNFDAFNRVAAVLRSRGFSVLNPAEWPRRSTYEAYLRFDVEMLARFADRVIFLDNWETSRGARLEMTVARGLGIPICFETQLDEVRP